MVGVFEAQQMGRFVHVMSVHKEVLALVDNEGMDIADGCAPSGLVDHVSQVAGGIGQMLRTVADRRNAL